LKYCGLVVYHRFSDTKITKHIAYTDNFSHYELFTGDKYITNKLYEQRIERKNLNLRAS